MMIMKDILCSRCEDRKSVVQGFCTRCYYATKRNQKTYVEMLIERNFIRDNKGILTDTTGQEWIVDLSDFDTCSKYLWIDNGQKYAKNNKVGYLHKLIYPNYKCVDHIDRNPLNNTRENLRDGSNGINGLNKLPYGISGRKGVTSNKKRWSARVSKNHLGTFDTIEEAYSEVLSYAKKVGLQEFFTL